MEEFRKNRSRVVVTVIIYLVVFWGLLPAFLFLLGFRIDKLVPVHLATWRGLQWLGWSLVVLGVGFIAPGIFQLWIKGKGLPISHLPPARFVASGIYKHFRHPIYIGYALAFAGASVLLGSFWSLTFSSPLLVFGWVGYALFCEEPGLMARFGKAYGGYKKATPLLIPKKTGQVLRKAFHPALEPVFGGLNKISTWTVLYRHGPVILVTYGVFVTLGALLFMVFSGSLFLLQGVDANHVVIIILGTALLTAFFAHLFWWLGHWKELIRLPWFGIRQVGFVSYGALFGFVFSSFAFGLAFGYPGLMMTDVIVRGMYLNYAVGRIGCLTYGCCWGKPSTAYGIIYRNPEAKVVRMTGGSEIPRHPTPLYSSLEGLLLFITLNALAYLQLPMGFLTAMGFLLYPIGRAFIELHRERMYFIHRFLNEGHLSCGVEFALGLALLFLISPQTSPFSPRPWNFGVLPRSLPLLPIIFLTSAIIFFITSFHWKRVGSW